MTKNPTWHSDLRNFPKKTVNFQVFWPFQCLSKKLFTLHRHLFSQVQESLEKSVKRRLGAQFTVERAFERALLSCCSRKFLFTFFSCALDFCAATAFFSVFRGKKKKWSRGFSEFLAMILFSKVKFFAKF